MSASDSPGLCAAVLAAGASTRFGSPKQLLRLAGTPVLQRAISNATVVAGPAVSVVLGAGAAEIAPLLRHSGASLVVNRDWSEGLASSVRSAVQAAPPGCEGLLLVLADQVLVTADDLKRLYAVWRRETTLLAAAVYGGGAGLPAIFPAWAFPDLLGLRGERDPSLVIRRHSDRLVRVPMPSAGLDVNTPEDLLEIEPDGSGRAGG
jgi:molybdenum cofactor cytidylyltransferase